MKKAELLQKVAEMGDGGNVYVSVDGDTGREPIERVEVDGYGNLEVIVKKSGIPANYRAKGKQEVREALGVF